MFLLLFKYILYYIVFLSFFPSFLFIFSFLGLPSLLVPSGLWHFALSVGVCSLADNNNNNNDIRGIATSLNYYSNLSLSHLMQVATWKSNRSSPLDTSRRSLPPRIISGDSALWSLLGTGCIPGPHSINTRLLSFYSPLASFEY